MSKLPCSSNFSIHVPNSKISCSMFQKISSGPADFQNYFYNFWILEHCIFCTNVYVRFRGGKLLRSHVQKKLEVLGHCNIEAEMLNLGVCFEVSQNLLWILEPFWNMNCRLRCANCNSVNLQFSKQTGGTGNPKHFSDKNSKNGSSK